MSNAEAQQQEPSMEEILASIRRIISEDGEEGEEQSPAAEAAETTDAAEEAPAAEPAADDVLELTNVVGEDGDVASLEESEVEAEAQGEVDDGLELTDEVAPEPVYEAPEAEETPSEGEEGEGLLSEDKADATADAFANLLGAMSVATPMGGEGRTLEDIVKALMRPLLKQWLDDNLPPLVERIIREEIERVVGRARDR